MKKYLAIDSGGTKTAAVLYGEDLSRLGACVTGSLRTNTTPDMLYEKNFSDMVKALSLEGKEIEAVVGTCEARVIKMLQSVCTVGKTDICGEAGLGLAAAGIFGDGILVLCGTGATVFALYKGERIFTGGYGAAVSDEGSGYYIGRQAHVYAIRDFEMRGERTLLTDMIPKDLGFSGRDEFKEAVFSIYSRKDRSPAASVAHSAPLVVKAAEKGDRVACGILADAGRIMGELTCGLIKKYGLPEDMPMTLSGSVWRGNKITYGEFLKTLGEFCPGRKPVIPCFEPILGALARTRYKANGDFTQSDAAKLKKEYPEFGYDINKLK